jgi:hypothetical protein
MYLRILSLSLLAAAVPAVADSTPASRAPGMTPPSNAAANAPAKTPASNLPPIDLTTVPEQCHAIAKQAGAASLQVALSARISLANCLADTAIAPLKLLDCEESMMAVDEAAAPSFELLGGVIVAAQDDTTKIVAEQARAELYNHMTARMLATLPAPGAGESSVGLYNARKAILDGLVARWRDGAAGSYEHILAIAKASPKLAKNRVVANAVQTARERLRLHVAQRTQQPPAEPASPDERDAPMTDTGEELR